MVKYLTFLALLMSFAQLFYWVYYFRGLITFIQPLKPDKISQPISLIICIKNELINIKKNLESVLIQDYKRMQIIISDDHSSDDSYAYLESLRKSWIDKEKGDFLLHKVNQNRLGKKQALKEAIVLSRHSWLLLTDADCKPNGDKWAEAMLNAAHSPEIGIVLGYSPLLPSDSLASRWAHYEGWLTGLQYISLAIKGQPYMGVGRNLAYQKELVSTSILSKYDDLASGDDDLTIMQIATADNTAICLDPESFVTSEAPVSWSAYYRQKTRHFSTATSYRLSTQLILSGYSLSQVLYYMAVIGLMCCGAWPWGLAFYLVRLIILFPIVQGLRKRLKAKFSFKEFVIMDFMQCFYYLIFSFAVLFPQKSKW